MKRVIINADDFGLSPAVNRAVIKAWREGILTSASIMAGGAAFDEAVQLARENPGLQVGLHLTLVQGHSVADLTNFPPLTDRHGRFTDDAVYAGMRYFFIKQLRKQLRREIEAQICKILDSGLALSHIDGHLNIHMHPTVFDLLPDLMRRYEIRSFRLTRERLAADLAIDRRRVVGKGVDAFIFGRLAARCRPLLDSHRIRYADEVKGLLSSGNMTEEYLLKTIDSLGNGVTEIYFHPGCLPCPEIAQRMPGYHHAEELAALTSDGVRKRLAMHGVRLSNYRGEEKAYG